MRGGKAEVLQFLAPRLTAQVVPRLVFFTVGEWRRDGRSILAALVSTFGGERVAVRSATRHEDRSGSGLAGRYRTLLDVRAAPRPLAHAVGQVIASYATAGPSGDDDHVLVQAMVRDVRRSGVVLTRDPATGAAYDVIELAEGPRTDTVTGGRGPVARIAVRRGADLDGSKRASVAPIVAAARAVERVLTPPGALEIELAESADGAIAILQARPLGSPTPAEPRRDRRLTGLLTRLAVVVGGLAGPRPRLAGASTILGLMPDWNPAELIGAHPAPLATSLFRELVSDTTWQQARAALGYQALPGTRLVHVLAGRPYVDTRAAFNSFLPAGLPLATRTTLVEAWLARLASHPELHDRVELEVAQTALDFAIRATYAARFGRPLLPAARDRWLDALRGLTRDAIDPTPRGSLAAALRTVAAVEPDATEGEPSVSATVAALERCRRTAARPFAVVARHAFMAEAMLRSLVARAALAPERLADFRRSLTTVAGRFAADWGRVAAGRLPLAGFLASYGHLRPGAFDITSLPYALRDGALWERAPSAPPPAPPFIPSAAERAALTGLLAEAGLECSADSFLAWAAAAIVGREHAKFLFSRQLSAVLEALAMWGAERGLERDDLAHLTVSDLRRARVDGGGLVPSRVAAARARRRLEREVRLGPLVRDASDLFVVHEPPIVPTFVTDATVIAPPMRIDGRTLEQREVRGRIVCVESADPGYDWLFGRALGGLVTRFGGANSHMAIRCLELGVPAALGVGERLFEGLCRAPVVELRCGERAVREATCAP